MGISIQNPAKLVEAVWFTSLVLVFIFMICAIAYGSQNDDGDSQDAQAMGFAAIWFMLLAIAIAVGGSLVLKKYKTPYAVGFLLGVVTMICCMMLVLTALLDKEAVDCLDLNGRLDASIDNCQALGCEKAGKQPEFLVCCQTMTAYKWGDNDNAYYFVFGADKSVNGSANALQCPECVEAECDASVAAAVFSAFLFIVYAVFAFVLGRYRTSVIIPTDVEKLEDPPDEDPVVEATDVEVTEKNDEY